MKDDLISQLQIICAEHVESHFDELSVVQTHDELDDRITELLEEEEHMDLTPMSALHNVAVTLCMGELMIRQLEDRTV